MPSVHPRTIKRVSGLLAAAGFGLVLLGTLGPSVVAMLHSAQTPLLIIGIGMLAAAAAMHRHAKRSMWRSMGTRGFSYCGACNYPFDEQLTDDAAVTCSECGKRFRAGTSREWFRDLAG